MMTNSEKTLRYSLLAGTLYFVCMCVAHCVDFKVPILFIYYDVPSLRYQNLIIAFCLLAYAAFSWSAAQHLSVVPAFLFAMFGVVCGLSCINASDSLASAMLAGTSTMPYWIQTALIAMYVAWLLFIYIKARRSVTGMGRG